MFDKAIGLVEYETVPSGITAADRMVKAAGVEIIEAQPVCPGKYVVMICGNLSAVNAAIEVGTKEFENKVIDSFILGNPHEGIFKAINGTSKVEGVEAIGIIETYSAASIIVAADTAAKTAKVNLIEVRIAKGMAGKSFLLFSGEMAAVKASVDAASSAVSKNGMLRDKAVIPKPDNKIWDKII